jgi:hypothetical protein
MMSSLLMENLRGGITNHLMGPENGLLDTSKYLLRLPLNLLDNKMNTIAYHEEKMILERKQVLAKRKELTSVITPKIPTSYLEEIQYKMKAYNKENKLVAKPTKWDFKRCQKVASLCKTVTKFKKLFPSAYSNAQKYGFFEKITIHMDMAQIEISKSLKTRVRRGAIL